MACAGKALELENEIMKLMHFPIRDRLYHSHMCDCALGLLKLEEQEEKCGPISAVVILPTGVD